MAKEYDNSNIETVPMWPKECSVSGCYNETISALISVREPASQQTITRDFSEVGYLKGSGKGQKLELRGNLIFVRWVTRCHECYMAEVIATKKQQLNVDGDEKILKGSPD